MLSSLSYFALFSLVALGVFSGFLSGLLGIGGGVVIVPALVLLFGLDPSKAVGISVAVIVPTALVAALKHNAISSIDLKAVLFISVAAIVGAYLGAITNHILPGNLIKKVFGFVLIIIGINMLLSPQAKVITKQPNDSVTT